MEEIIKFTNKNLDIKGDLIAISTLRPWINAGRVGSIALNKLKNITDAKLVGSLKNPGSFFLCEIKRMISSLSPGGAESVSISVTKPCLYSRVASSSRACVSLISGGPPARSATG